jgi:hypothetical protein
MSRNLIEEAKSILNEEPWANANDIKNLKTVLIEFDLEDDFEPIKYALSNNSKENRRLRNLVFGLCEELFMDRTTLKRLGKGFRGE